jgi:S1-C subfamily serine protease
MFQRRMQTALLFLVVMTTAFCAAATAEQPLNNGDSTSLSLRKITAATVLIESVGSDGVSLGSGVVTTILGKKYVLTANHVIRGTSGARLTSLADGSSGYSSETGGWSVKYDIAAIALPKAMRHLPAIPFCRSKLRPGTRVFIAAFPAGVPAITFGQIAGYDHRGTEMYHTAPTVGGSSGGMIINDKGRLCGIHLGVYPYSGIKFATPSDLILRLIAIHGK